MALRLIFGRLLFIRYALDDWYFARDFIHRVRPGIEERLDRFAAELVRIARETDADEIIVDGHSLGAPLSLVVVDRALKLDPELSRRGRPLHLVSSGSSLLKVALHPAAGWLREAVARVANAPIYWVEFQALVDIINVYKVDPLVALGLAATGKPIIKIMRIRVMVEEPTYRRFHLNFLRIHRQAMMGNERRYYYDYYMLCCGPIPLADRVANAEAAVAIFTVDGALTAGGSVDVGRCDGARAVTATIAKFVWLGFMACLVSATPSAATALAQDGGALLGAGLARICPARRSLAGLGIVPFIYVTTVFPRFANYPFMPALAYLGIAVDRDCLWLFYRTHHDFGANWSVSLDLRERHTLVTTGVYALIRHPMYRVLVHGARPSPAAAQLDRRICRFRWLWRALLRSGRPGGAHDDQRLRRGV